MLVEKKMCVKLYIAVLVFSLGMTFRQGLNVWKTITASIWKVQSIVCFERNCGALRDNAASMS
jgi:hypothetical protein